MRRRVFDQIVSAGGVVAAVVFLIAGGLLAWGHSYIDTNVHNQLAAQRISFPPKAAFAHAKAGTEITPGMIPSVSQYAGQQLLTGAQARVYADDFIAVHLSDMPYQGVYSRISAAAMANPGDAKLAQLEQTSFQGTTLRGLLLEAYGFSMIATVMFWGMIVAWAMAAVMASLVGLGVWHARHVAPDEELLAVKPHPQA